jgi:hypothetical protein
MAIESIVASQPRRIGWVVGMLLVFVAIQVGVVLPAAVLFLLGYGAEVAGPAMIGGLLATWTTLIAALRVGHRRGWWA